MTPSTTTNCVCARVSCRRSTCWTRTTTTRSVKTSGRQVEAQGRRDHQPGLRRRGQGVSAGHRALPLRQPGQLPPDGLVELSSTNFSEIATELQHRCYIKFRYSLFAGPPPYELVSNSAPTVTAHEMETWFTVQIDIARHDLAEGRVFGLTDKDELHLEQLVACAHSKLGPWDESDYAALTEIVLWA